MRRNALLLALLVATACGGRGDRAAPAPVAGSGIARPLEIYHQLGMLAGPDEFAAVARFATLRGPADSTFVLISMSMPNNAIRFQRDANLFSAEYSVKAALLRDTVTLSSIERREVVRVATFAETTRTEESIVFQDVMTALPGRYVVRLHVADRNSSRGFQAIDTIAVPAYPRDAQIAQPILVYRGQGRERASARPAVVMNPRNTVSYGGEIPRVYLESYDPQRRPVQLRIVDESGAQLWKHEAALTEGSADLRHATIDVPASSLPVGKLWLEAFDTAGATPSRTPLLVTISDQWMVSNFDDVLDFLHYIAYPAEIDSLRTAVGPERRERWERFWVKRDPLPATPGNEFRDQFFERVRTATEQFTEGGRPGWETDRGRVYIVLGPPADQIQRVVGRDGAQANLIEWLYESLPGGRLVLQFFDRTGFGRYELTQSSEAQFRIVAARIRPRN